MAEYPDSQFRQTARLLTRGMRRYRKQPCIIADESLAVIDRDDGSHIVLTHRDRGESKSWRCVDPLLFSTTTAVMFDTIESTDERQVCELSEHSRIMLRNTESRALVFARICAPEPTADHFGDMFRLASFLEAEPAIIAVSLAGSGSSKPHHFHAHVMPLVYGLYGDDKRSIDLEGLLKGNVKVDQDTCHTLRNGRLQTKEITHPIWGLEIGFDKKGVSPEAIGRLLYLAVHLGVRYRSQLRLSYNLYIDTRVPNVARVLFRRVETEFPFSMSGWPVSMRNSLNRYWRWGWSEMIGWLNPVEAPEGVDSVRWDFWRRVYQRIGVEQPIQKRIREQVEEGLTLTGWAHCLMGGDAHNEEVGLDGPAGADKARG